MLTDWIAPVGGCHGDRPDDTVLGLHSPRGGFAQDGKVQPEAIRRHRKLVLTISI